MGLNVSQVADFLLDGLKAGLAERETARLIVSGGSSPVPVFEVLRATDFPSCFYSYKSFSFCRRNIPY